jgi:hypothetical protein
MGIKYETHRVYIAILLTAVPMGCSSKKAVLRDSAKSDAIANSTVTRSIDPPHPTHRGACASFDAEWKDIGPVDAGGSKEFTFLLTNAGDTSLAVYSVFGSCGCLTADFTRELAPGANGEIRARFEPELLWSGRMQKTLSVSTSDPVRPVAHLALRAEVMPFLKTEPRLPLVAPLRRGKTYLRTLRISPRQGSGVKFKSVRSLDPAVSAKLVLADKGAGTYSLLIAVRSPNRPGDFATSLQLYTTSPRVPIIPVGIVGRATTGPVVAPSRVFVSTMRADAVNQELRRLRVFTRSGKLRLLDASTKIPGLKLEVEKIKPEREYAVTARYVGGWKSGGVDGAIRLHFDDRRFPTVDVPFSATVQ